ncbi:flavodoxin domain-containing protein [Amycolatopsis orientalis]|uniref:flavodoxin domain-containing protein n=1 Tax=Amycolatopsis orientalis TaxID=31958 RepID=UPI00056C8EA2|nr:flavodoxin domain-containing protein [Amycolatopsis orientalis]
MKILVAVATRHGATRDIADEVGRVLAEDLEARGITTAVDVLYAGNVGSIDDYDAVVLGSAVYLGHWLEDATAFAGRHRQALRAKPVWLFSSGPVGDEPKPAEEPVDVAETVNALRAREHRVFPGRIDRGRMKFAERALVTALRVKDGDYRDWPAVRAWAAAIAGVLAGERGTVGSDHAASH